MQYDAKPIKSAQSPNLTEMAAMMTWPMAMALPERHCQLCLLIAGKLWWEMIWSCFPTAFCITGQAPSLHVHPSPVHSINNIRILCGWNAQLTLLSSPWMMIPSSCFMRRMHSMGCHDLTTQCSSANDWISQICGDGWESKLCPHLHKIIRSYAWCM